MMNRTKYTGCFSYVGLLAAALVALFSGVGCTDIILGGTVEEYGTESSVNIAFDWSGTSFADSVERPDSLTLVMGRMVDSSRIWVRCGSAGASFADSLMLPNGDWLCVALNENVEGVSFTGLEEFKTGDLSSVKSIVASVDTFTRTQAMMIHGGIDPNPGMPYYQPVSGLAGAFVRARINGAQENNVVMKMYDVSAPVTFNLKVKIEDGVEVEKITGEVSGVPGVVALMSKEVVASRTGKAMFDIDPVDGGGSVSGGTAGWRGVARVTGIVAPLRSDVVVGDGILCVRVYVKVGGKRMIYVASVNLKPLLDEKPVLVPTDRSAVYRCPEDGAFALDIPATLWLTPVGVMPEEDGSGVVDWVNQAKIDGGV